MTVRRACKSPRIGLPASTSAAPATAAKQAYRLIPPEVAAIDDGAVLEIGEEEGRVILRLGPAFVSPQAFRAATLAASGYGGERQLRGASRLGVRAAA